MAVLVVCLVCTPSEAQKRKKAKGGKRRVGAIGKCVRARARARARVCVCITERERERESECVCVYECVRAHE